MVYVYQIAGPWFSMRMDSYFFNFLTDDHGLILREVVGRNFEVQRSWALPYTSGDIVVRTVAGTEPAAEVTSLTDGDTTKVSTDTYKKHISFCSPR